MAGSEGAAGGAARCVAVLYTTTNAGKLGEARACFRLAAARVAAARPGEPPLVFEVRSTAVEVPEPQAAPGEVAREKARRALEALRRDAPEALEGVDLVMAEDAALGLDCLAGFPGPYIKAMMQALAKKPGADTAPAALADIVGTLGEDGVTASCNVAAVRVGAGAGGGQDEPRVYAGELRGRIVAPRGEGTHGGAISWSPAFLPDGDLGGGRCMGELTLEEQAEFSHRRVAIQALVDDLAAGRL